MSKALAVNATVSGRQRFFDFLYKWGMLLTVVLLVAVFGLASDNFLDPFNIINILRSIAIVTVIAIGVSISLTIGGFDLSVGSTASLANALVISLFVWHGLGTTEAILITLALCTLVGLFNAFLIVVLRIPDMLATLASLFVIQGVAMTYSYGGSITENMVLPSGEMAEGTIPAAFGALGQVPTIVIIMLVVTLVAQLALSFTTAARLSGVSGLVPSVDWLLYSAIRKEALLTSQIEGTQATLTDLFDEEAGFKVIADSRIANIRKMKEAGVDADYALIRIPMLSELEEVVELCTYSLVSELETIKSISRICEAKGKEHSCVLMFDMGDLREGFWFTEIENMCEELKKISPLLKIEGVSIAKSPAGPVEKATPTNTSSTTEKILITCFMNFPR